MAPHPPARTRRTRRTARTAAGLVVLALAGCALVPGGGDDDDPQAVADRLAQALGEHALDGVALADPAAAERFAATVAGLQEHPVRVTARDVRTQDDAATVTLDWRWRLGERDWEYETTARLAREDGAWVVDWQPAALEPSLQAGEVLAVDRVPAERGDILGAGGAPLVTARPVVRYGLDKSVLAPGQVSRSAARVARAVGVDVARFRAAARAAGPRAFVEAIVLREDEAGDAVAPELAAVPGALAVPDELPLAPTRRFAAQLLGRVGPATAEVVEESEGRVRPGDEVGLSGLQARADERLAGRAGLRVRAVPRTDCPQWPSCPAAGESREVAAWAATPGRPLRLTLDPDLQQAAEDALDRTGGADAPPSALVALRPSSGEVLALANGPGNDGLDAAATGRYAPGSTFKVVTALALLRAGVSGDDVLSCPATLSVDGKRFKNYDDYPAGRLGAVSLTTAVANSCNTALIGERGRLTADDLTRAAAALGLGVDHDLGFPAYLGQVPRPGGATEKAASLIGQGKVLASPLAMASVAASVAAGRAVVPTLVSGTAPSAAPEEPLTGAEATALRALLRAVVTEGSARFLADVPGEVGAKTGTAEYGRPDAAGALPTHTWMIATRGDLAVAVFVETGESGSATAGPVLEVFLR